MASSSRSSTHHLATSILDSHYWMRAPILQTRPSGGQVTVAASHCVCDRVILRQTNARTTLLALVLSFVQMQLPETVIVIKDRETASVLGILQVGLPFTYLLPKNEFSIMYCLVVGSYRTLVGYKARYCQGN